MTSLLNEIKMLQSTVLKFSKEKDKSFALLRGDFIQCIKCHAKTNIN